MDMLPLPVLEASKPSQDDIRILTPEEIQQYVKPGYDATGNPLPNSAESLFVGVIRDGKVVASLGLQIKLHAQPLQIEDGYASVLPSLIATAEKIILERSGPQWVYLFAPAGKLAQIAHHFGMQTEQWVVMSKLVAPEIPPKFNVVVEMTVPQMDLPLAPEPEGTVQ